MGIDVHPKLGSKLSWSGLLFNHLEKNQVDRVHLTSPNESFDPKFRVRVCGPFLSAFSRCFEMSHSPGCIAKSKYETVVLVGSGIGLPSALSALHAFVERRRAGIIIPSNVCLLWRLRNAEDLELCWDTLHRLIYDAKGLCDQQTWSNEGGEPGRPLPLDYQKHCDLHDNLPWDESSEMIDWLSVKLYVSSWSRDDGARREQEWRQNQESSNPLYNNAQYGETRKHAERVHKWLMNQICGGRHQLLETINHLLDLSSTRRQKLERAVAADQATQAAAIPGSLPNTIGANAATSTGESREGSLQLGQRVGAHGVKVLTQLNGQAGSILGFHPGTQRWKVQMDDGTRKLLKPSDLQVLHPHLVPGVRVLISGLSDRSELNGQQGEMCVSFCGS